MGNIKDEKKVIVQVSVREDQRSWLGEKANTLDVSMAHIVRRLIDNQRQKEEKATG